MRSRGFFATANSGERSVRLVSDGQTLDLGDVYPKMFVRIHDIAKGQDLEGNDPDLDDLAQDVNRRIDQYAAAYPELQALLSVFRAYVVAVRISREDASLCIKVRSIPYLDAERPLSPLPDHHPSQIFLTVGKYTYVAGQRKMQPTFRRGTVTGGVALRGKVFYDATVHPGQTKITQDIKAELAQSRQGGEWTGASGRRFIALTLDSGELVSEVGDIQPGQLSTPAEVLKKQDEIRSAVDNKFQAQESQKLAQQEVAKRAREDEAKVVEAAERQWSEEERKAAAEKDERQLLADAFGPPIDDDKAKKLLPYAMMASAAYDEEAGEIKTIAVHRITHSNKIFRDLGYSGTSPATHQHLWLFCCHLSEL